MNEAPVARLTIRDGGWILIVAGVMVAALVTWALAGVFSGKHAQGGADVASYGFDLTTTLVPASELTPTGQPRDFLRPLIVEKTMPGSEMVAFNERHRKRYVVSGDRVIGVEIAGERRAYPLYLLRGHEVILDTLGDTPIAVTYSPLCDGIAVFDRRVNDRTLSLHVSGLLHNATGLLYDEAPVPSLWRQIDGKALTGPAAERAQSMRLIPNVTCTTWADWLATYPDTTVPVRDEGNVRLYQMFSYVREHASPNLAFPVTPPPANDWPIKTPCVIVEIGSERGVYPLPAMLKRAEGGEFRTTLGSTALRIRVAQSTEGAAWRIQTDDGTPFVARGAFWFTVSSTLGFQSSLAQP